MENKDCIYCGKETLGTYCHHCGQKQEVHRLTWKYFFQDLQKRWFGFDNNFVRTVKDLTIRPGKVIQSTIDGIRVKYIGPVGYYFLIITLFVLTISAFDIDMVEYTKGITSSMQSGEVTTDQQAMQQKLNRWIFENFRIFSFFLLPFFIGGYWIVFKNKGYNYIETAVVVLYSQGHSAILSILSLLGFVFFDLNNTITYITPISYIYMSYVAANFYKGNSIWNFIKGFLALLVAFIILMGLFIIVGITAGMIIAIIDKG